MAEDTHALGKLKIIRATFCLQSEVHTASQRVSAENKALNQFDPARMKKNLDASKKKLTEKQKDNESLQKALKESRKEQAVLERRVKELEAKAESAGAENAGEQASEDQAA